MTFPDNDDFLVDDVDDDVRAAIAELRQGGSEPPAEKAAPVETDIETGDDEQEHETDAARQAREDRDERGRFKPKAAKGDEPGAKQPGAEKAATEQPDGSGTPPAKPTAPPPSWGVKAKAAWERIPDEVRAEIAKRETEVAQGFAALRDYKDLKPYAEEATRNNTSIKRVLDEVFALDRLMGQDLAGGLEVAAHSFTKDRAQLGQVFAKLAQKYGAPVSAPDQNGGHHQPGPGADPLAEALQPLLQQALKPIQDQFNQYRTSREEADRNAQVQHLSREIDRFAADPKNIFYENVKGDIARIIGAGLVSSGNPAADLQAAYEMAIWQNPETRAALIEKQAADAQGSQRQREQDKAAKARNASRSMGGSRIPGTVTKHADDADGPDDIEADVRKAFRMHNQA